ncbi:sortase domain-bontaining protein [Kitasatospora sp. NPDC057198]|uniref:sortase domain-containing protein n=1 Tax=Kitasatospora sp. NPDC057198 TaxID=3346046 RepID=UPI0036419647
MPPTSTAREGVDRGTVLDSGAVGHHEDTRLPHQQRNPVLAAHRNGHAEPLRHPDRLEPGDPVVLRTPAAVHTYVLDRELPETGRRCAPGPLGLKSFAPSCSKGFHDARMSPGAPADVLDVNPASAPPWRQAEGPASTS